VITLCIKQPNHGGHMLPLHYKTRYVHLVTTTGKGKR